MPATVKAPRAVGLSDHTQGSETTALATARAVIRGGALRKKLAKWSGAAALTMTSADCGSPAAMPAEGGTLTVTGPETPLRPAASSAKLRTALRSGLAARPWRARLNAAA